MSKPLLLPRRWVATGHDAGGATTEYSFDPLPGALPARVFRDPAGRWQWTIGGAPASARPERTADAAALACERALRRMLAKAQVALLSDAAKVMPNGEKSAAGRAEWPFGDLRPLSYDVIYADPAWQFKTRSKKGLRKSPQRHYKCMSLPELMTLPVGDLAARDCVLLMWVTFPMLRQGFRLMETWGFDYKTGASWAKRSPTGRGWSFGGGYIFRSASELLLVATMGRPGLPESRRERNLFEAPVREHSRKPDEVYPMIERMWPRRRYCELFARTTPRPGWDVHGDQVGLFERAA